MRASAIKPRSEGEHARAHSGITAHQTMMGNRVTMLTHMAAAWKPDEARVISCPLGSSATATRTQSSLSMNSDGRKHQQGDIGQNEHGWTRRSMARDHIRIGSPTEKSCAGESGGRGHGVTDNQPGRGVKMNGIKERW